MGTPATDYGFLTSGLTLQRQVHIDWNNHFWHFMELSNDPQLGCQVENQEPKETLRTCHSPMDWSKRLLLGETAGSRIRNMS